MVLYFGNTTLPAYRYDIFPWAVDQGFYDHRRGIKRSLTAAR